MYTLIVSHTLAWLRISHIKTKSSCGTANLRETTKKKPRIDVDKDDDDDKNSSLNADKLHVLTMQSNNNKSNNNREITLFKTKDQEDK